MKNIFLITAVLLYGFVYSQLDTLNYLKQFEANKVKYIGKPFSVLLNDMTQIQPKTNFSFSAFNNKNKRIYTDFNFVNKDYIRLNSITLSIYWQTPIPSNDIKSYQNKNKCVFTDDEKSFYGNKIIKDIKVYR